MAREEKKASYMGYNTTNTHTHKLVITIQKSKKLHIIQGNPLPQKFSLINRNGSIQSKFFCKEI